ncbi:MAG: thioredoxin domain-containing protein [Myxococcales bacterium]|nr:thioredoxin domain-containing protein [Myxococcales bacterium]MCB9706597.1 thioredoxin domain-containing protein [Myxococcales bacterium]
MLLAVAALILSIGLEVIHVRAYLDPSVASFCSVDARLDCDAVALSRASVLLGIPTAVWGVAGFWAMLVAILRAPGLFLPIALIAALATTGLLVYEVAVLGAICMFCEGVHLLSLALLVIAWRRRGVASARDALAQPKRLLAEFGLPIVLLGAVAVAAPPYWVLVSWRSGPRLDHGVDEEGHPWIGASSPTLTIHEYIDYGCPHCAAASSRMRLKVGANASKIRLVRHQQPRMRCVGRVFVEERCELARAAVCAGEQGRFWEMDDWLFGHAPGEAKVDLGAGARELGLDLAVFDACMKDMRVYEKVDNEVRTANKRKIRETPLYEVDGAILTPKELAELLDERL